MARKIIISIVSGFLITLVSLFLHFNLEIGLPKGSFPECKAGESCLTIGIPRGLPLAYSGIDTGQIHPGFYFPNFIFDVLFWSLLTLLLIQLAKTLKKK